MHTLQLEPSRLLVCLALAGLLSASSQALAGSPGQVPGGSSPILEAGQPQKIFPYQVDSLVWERPEAQAALAAWHRQPLRTAPGATAQVGEQQVFQVYNFETGSYDAVRCSLERQGALSEVWVALDQLGASQVTEAALDSLAQVLEEATPEGSLEPDSGLVGLEQSVFGPPPDVDGSGRVKVLVVDIQDGWTETCGCGYVAGFFDPVNLSLLDPHSNRADILYVDATPAIYTDTSPANAAQVFSTLAHEYQHLIHANQGALYLFQNEGQSEWAQGLCGFASRNVTYLQMPAELNQPLYGWRNTAEVAYDYQRASLLHFYLAGQVGASALGSLSRGGLAGEAAYEAALGGAGSLENALVSFHLANWLNDNTLDPAYGYPDSRHQGLRIGAPTLQYVLGGSTPETTRSLEYGGAEYLQWMGVENLTLTTRPDVGVRLVAVGKALADGQVSVRSLTGGSSSFSGEWESVTLVAVNVSPVGNDELAAGARDYAYAASWTPLPVSEQRLGYVDLERLYWLAALPNGDETALSVRYTPAVTGELRELSLRLTSYLDGSPNPVGTGRLRVVLSDSRLESGSGANAVYVPGTPRGAVEIPLSSLQSGQNLVPITQPGWTVTAGEDFHLQLSMVGDSASSIAFDLDDGTTDTAHPWYYPARTRRYLTSTGSWSKTYQRNGNLAVEARVFGSVTSLPVAGAQASPKDGSVELWTDLPFYWYPLSGAVSYRLQLSRYSDFRILDADLSGLTGTVKQLNGLAMDTTYFWRVAADNVLGTGPWSPVWQLRTRAPAQGEETLEYYDPATVQWAVSLPFGDETAWGVRFSPALTGEISSFTLNLSRPGPGGTNPVGEGSLRVTLAESRYVEGEGAGALYLPDQVIDSLDVPFSQLSAGRSVIDLSREGWKVTAGKDFFLLVEVVPTSADASITLDLDNGSTDITNPDYYPARSRRYVASADSWEYTWLNHGNFAVSVGLSEGGGGGCSQASRRGPSGWLGLLLVIPWMRSKRRKV